MTMSYDPIRARLFPPIAGSTSDDNVSRGGATGTAADPASTRDLTVSTPEDFNERLRRGAQRGVIAPTFTRPPLTGAQAFGMSPAQVAAYQGTPLPPAPMDFGGGQRGERRSPGDPVTCSVSCCRRPGPTSEHASTTATSRPSFGGDEPCPRQ